jgi:hypothetical protein
MNGAHVNGVNGFDDVDQFNHLESKATEETPREMELPDNRQERLAILLKNMPNEDLVHINEKRVPAFLRIDKDV